MLCMHPESMTMPEDKTILEQVSETPDVIAEFSREQLEEAKTALIEAGQSYVTAIKSGESEDTKADLAAANEAKERLEAVKARLAEFEAEDAETAEAAGELEVVFTPEEPEAEEETPEAEETGEEPEAEETPEATEEVEEEKEPALAASDKVSMSAIAKRLPAKMRQPEPEPAVVASPGALVASDYRGGLATPRQIGEAALKVWNSFGKSTKTDQRALVASFDERSQHPYEATGDVDHDSAEIDRMLKDLRKVHTVEALTAAAGFCSPSEPLYDYFGIAERAGMVSLPSMNASRGQITYRQSPSYASVLANTDWANAAGQTYTNANAEAGASKNTFSITCPSTTTCSVDAYPVILQFGNFTDRFDPETVANAIENTMVFHDHYVNAQEISQMVSASTLTATGDTGGGGLVNVANLIGFEAARYRDTYRMSPTATLELVAPAWIHDALVADLVARNSTTSFENARARVAAVFASLNVRVQFVQDYQSIGDNADGGWPNGADFLLYAPGTFVRLDGGSLDLGIVRDSTLNATNEFQTFMESFSVVCEIGHDSWLLDGVEVCPRGSAAADVTLDCNPGFGS